MIGIYRITNLKNSKNYIGQSTDIERRFKYHKYHLTRGDHDITDLQKDWNKYGESAFEFVIIQECDRGELGKFEQRKIRELDTTNPDKGYNTIKGQYVAANPDRGKNIKHQQKYLKRDPEPEDHPMCKKCKNNCKQYITAHIVSCPKMR